LGRAFFVFRLNVKQACGNRYLALTPCVFMQVKAPYMLTATPIMRQFVAYNAKYSGRAERLGDAVMSFKAVKESLPWVVPSVALIVVGTQFLDRGNEGGFIPQTETPAQVATLPVAVQTSA